jgi:hypothetical protein
VRWHASGDFAALPDSLPQLLFSLTEAFLGPLAATEEVALLEKELPPGTAS